ncbi:MAG TPA: DNA polymerase IV [Verrucomicrobiae bacterium]|nr:DNA polymerase IV [Verrucomicrobiae bacterium]
MRAIVHLDADAFFASVEQAADPRLRGKPIAVGGEKRGIIASASYEARRFGIYTPMPTVRARRLCPKLILLPGDFDKYELFSRLMFSYAYDFTPDVEIGSIDEGYFDLTGARKPAVGIAQTIRQAIRQALKLSVSEGIGSNKLVSQIASKLKKPSAFEFVPPGQEAGFLSPLANKWLPGIGPKTAIQLNAAGLAFIGQIAHTPVELLNLLVGRMAPQLHRFAHGLDERAVIPVRAPAKSYGEQETFAVDTTDEDFLEATLRRMADKLMAKVRQDAKSIRTVTVKIRYNDMDEQQAAESLNEPSDLETDIYSLTTALLRKAWQRRVSLRLVSLKLSNVYQSSFRGALALDTDARRHDAQQRLAGIVDQLRQKFGHAALLRGHDFVFRSIDHDHSCPGAELPTRRRAFGSASITEGCLGKTTYRDPSPQPSPLPKGRGGNIGKPGCSPCCGLHSNTPLGRGGTASEAHLSEIRNRKSEIASIPLNVHSYYSFLDSTLSISAIIELAKRYELPAIALTDKNNLHGAVEFAQAAAEAGIKPIIGAELHWHGYRFCLYVQNQTGYQNLCQILNLADERAENSTSSMDLPSDRRSPLPHPLGGREGARKAGEGIQGHYARIRPGQSLVHQQWLPPYEPAPSPLPSPPRRGRGSQHARGGSRVADEWFNVPTDGLLAVGTSPALAPLFPGRFYLAVSSPSTLAESINPSALPLVASFPIHYALPADRWKYDIVQSIRTLTLLRQAHPEKRLDGQYHFPPPAQLQQLFAAHPRLLAHSHEIAERCSFRFELGKPQFPSYSPPDGSAPAAFLRRLVMEGLQRRYPHNHLRLKAQLDEELAMILEVGYEEYFLAMWDILQGCRRRGIDWITRGSAADSLACYCLEISNVCPIRFDLYFRRFLNKERMALNKLPDIDVDFPHDRKDDVIDLIFEKYGSEQTAVVGGFSTFQSRSAFAEVAKVLGVSEFQVRRFTERLPHFSRASELAQAVTDSLECHDLPLGEEPYATALQMACFLDGFPRYPKMHPCGLVLSRQPMRQITPCFRSAKGYPTTHFDMDAVEAVGLIKMDILAQGGLAVMRDVLEMVTDDFPSSIGNGKSETGMVALPSPAGPFDERQVWSLIASGQARAVHHIESPAMISLCKMCNARDIDTLIAIVSVIRPGAANESKKMEFARRYQGLSPIRYPHASLERCLRSTYGLVVYEEHILQICEAFAGLPPGRADLLRRALGKNKTELINQIQAEFAACAQRLGRTAAEIAEVWDLVAGFRGYAFCKAHSTAYGVEAYQSAWLKLHYPAQFMAAVLTNGKGFYSPLVYILECHRLGIPLLPPSVNQPGPQFTVVGGAIRVPILNLKGLTLRTRETILRERERAVFVSLPDFVLRVQALPEEMETLIRVGAFDEFGQTRTAQYWQYKHVPVRAERFQFAPQIELFPTPTGVPAISLAEPTRLQRLQAEEELLGYPVSGHPLELYPDIAWETYCPVNRLGEYLGQQIVTCGLIIEQRLFHQVTGEPMKFITIADRTGIIETELFAQTYRSYGLNTIRYRVLEINAKVECFENGRGYTLRVLRAGKPRTRSESAGGSVSRH